nr:hypothetical protein [Tanacetum cinerariifolium]
AGESDTTAEGSIVFLCDLIEAVVSDSPAPYYDSADESSLCSTPLLLKNLDGAEPGFGTKTVKSILKSKFTFKAETLKGITLNEPSLASARGNKISSASKTNSGPVDMTCELRLLLSCLGLFLFVMALFIHAS